MPPLAIRLLAVVPLLLAPAGSLAAQTLEAPTDRPYGAFTFQDSVQVPVPPEEAFDRFLEVDAWWDHHFSEDPLEFFIEARPGGGFYEIFDESGYGVRHATVITVMRGSLLRLRGPLGLTGFALDGVYSLSFRTSGSGTLVHLDARGAGELEEEWPALIQRVWHHFLVERFKPYVEGTLG